MCCCSGAPLPYPQRGDAYTDSRPSHEVARNDLEALTLQTRTLVPGGDDTLLTFTLEHKSQYPGYEIGRFRIWATNALSPQENLMSAVRLR